MWVHSAVRRRNFPRNIGYDVAHEVINSVESSGVKIFFRHIGSFARLCRAVLRCFRAVALFYLPILPYTRTGIQDTLTGLPRCREVARRCLTGLALCLAVARRCLTVFPLCLKVARRNLTVLPFCLRFYRSAVR
jgi:hypothetical protein